MDLGSLQDVRTRDELAAALRVIRGASGLSFPEIRQRTRRLDSPVHDLPVSTVNDMCKGKTLPREEALRSFLWACDVPAPEQAEILAALRRVRTPEMLGGALPSIADCDPITLGVHRSAAAAAGAGRLPTYVSRHFDAELRSAVASQYAFILIVGESSVGKTRSAYEAVLAELPDWNLWRPGGANDVAASIDNIKRRTVVWLDESRRFLADPASATALTSILRQQRPIVVIGTLWPDLYHVLLTSTEDDGEDQTSAVRSLLGMARVITVNSVFTPAERREAARAEPSDERLRSVLESRYGITQALAGAPALVERWTAAPDAYTKAIITAAVDARRMGINGPLPLAWLRAAAAGYLSSGERATASGNWFEAAMAYATEPLRGATAAVQPVGQTVGHIDGYDVADFLVQHSAQTRSDATLPDDFWRACIVYLTEPEDLQNVGRSAQRRTLLPLAESLLYAAMEAGVRSGYPLAQMYWAQGRKDEAIEVWRKAAAAGDPAAPGYLARLLAGQKRWGELDEISGALPASGSMLYDRARYLADRGKIAEAEALYRTAWESGDEDALTGWIDMLDDAGQSDKVVPMLTAMARDGSNDAERVLAIWHEMREELADAVRVLRGMIDRGDRSSRMGLADVLLKQERCEDAIDLLRLLTDEGHFAASRRLVDVYEYLDRPDLIEAIWRDQVAAHRTDARIGYARFLHEQGRFEEAAQMWQAEVDAGSPYVRLEFARTMAALGDADAVERLLEESISHGERDARSHFAEYLAVVGRLDEAQRMVDEATAAGESSAAKAYATLLDESGRTEDAEDVLRNAAAGGNFFAATELLKRSQNDDGGISDEKISDLRRYFGS